MTICVQSLDLIDAPLLGYLVITSVGLFFLIQLAPTNSHSSDVVSGYKNVRQCFTK